MSLDDKLKTLLREVEMAGRYGEVSHVTYDAIADKIKQAFADEGYVKEPTYTVHKPQCVTGAEWYDRFEKELGNSPPELQTPDEITRWVNLAAKKAAGLSDD